MGNAIEVVIKNNDQKYFLSILANQRRFNSLTNFPFFFSPTLWEFCSEHTKSFKKSSEQRNGLNTSKNYLLKIVRGFRVLEYTLWQKNENPEMPEIDWKLPKSIKYSVLMVYRYQKTAKKQSIYYLRTILA